MEFSREPGRIFALDKTGKLLAEVTFPEREGVVVINHTFCGCFASRTGSGWTAFTRSGRYPTPGRSQSTSHLFLCCALV